MPKVMIEMEMPKSCGNCLIKGLEDICPLVDFEYVGGYAVTRHEKCPLQEVKE